MRPLPDTNDGLESPESIEEARGLAEEAVALCGGCAALDDLREAGESYPISDVICNLLHLGDRHGFGHERLIEEALNHWEAGRIKAPEDLPCAHGEHPDQEDGYCLVCGEFLLPLDRS